MKEKHSFGVSAEEFLAGSRASFTPPLNSQFRFGLGLCLICRPRRKKFLSRVWPKKKKEIEREKEKEKEGLNFVYPLMHFFA